jgi:hypothetical protein
MGSLIEVGVGRCADGGHGRGYRRMVGGTAPVGDTGASSGGQRDEADRGGWLRCGQLRHQGDALAGGDQRQYGGEVVGVVAYLGSEAGRLADAQCDGVADGAGGAHDPGGVPGGPDWVADRGCGRRRCGEVYRLV